MAWTPQIVGGIVPVKFPMALYKVGEEPVRVNSEAEYTVAINNGFSEDIPVDATKDHLINNVVNWQRNIKDARDKLLQIGVDLESLNLDELDESDSADDEALQAEAAALRQEILDLQAEVVKWRTAYENRPKPGRKPANSTEPNEAE